MPAQPKNSGKLAEQPLVEIILWIHVSRYTGALALTHETMKKLFVFDQGKLTLARSSLPEEGLIQVLFKENALTPDQIKPIAQTLEGKEPYQQGEILMKENLIEPSVLYGMLQRQLEMRLGEALTWKEGKYGLIKDIPRELTRIPLDKGLPEVVFRALVKKHELAPIRSELSGEVPALQALPDLSEGEMRMTGKEASLFRLVDANQTIEQVSKKAGLSIAQAVPVLLALKDLGLLQFVEKKAVSPDVRVDKDAVLGEIRKKLTEAKSKDYYAILGVSSKATDGDIKKAYFELAKRYHPDRVTSSQTAVDQRKCIEDYFSMITIAHSTLSNPAQRQEYDASLATEKSGLSLEQAEKILNSELEFQKALVFVKKGNFTEAAPLLKQAIALYAEEPEYHLYLGWCLFKQGAVRSNSSDVQNGRNMISAALQKNPKLFQGYYYLGMIDKHEGKSQGAKQNFEKVLALNPGHTESASELRVMQMRETKKEEGKGIMGIFGKRKA